MSPSARTTFLLSAAIFVAAFFGFALLFLRFPILYDADSYMHLAIARLYAAQGLAVDTLPWARMSVMHDGYGDKELLFHLLLAPFTSLTDAAVGGRLALALLNATLVALLAALGHRAIGAWGIAVPAIVYLTAAGFLPRAIRLRPELVALMLLLAATGLAATRRYRWLALVAFAMALSYTAFHVLFGLALIWLAVEYRVSRRLEWRLLAWPLLGLLLGVVAHPQFPKNLDIWWIQNALFFVEKGRLGVGNEIFAPSLEAVLLGNLGIAIALAALFRSGEPTGEPAPERRHAPYFVAAAALFTLLYFFMARMITYAAPFAALAVVFAMRDARLRPSRFIAAGMRVPLVVAMLLALGVSVPRLTDPMLLTLIRADPNLVAEAELEQFGKAMPKGARVAATWEQAELYCFWAPQATYLNLFDPIFMALPFPEEFELQRRIFAGQEPDSPFAIASRLGSTHVAFDRGLAPQLLDRISGDPRTYPVYMSFNVIAGLRPAPRAFFVDWRVALAETTSPSVPEDGGASWPAYPLAAEPGLRALEGYVDLGRVAKAPACGTFVHRLEVTSRSIETWEFSPWGPARVMLDGQPLAEARSSRGAILGRGLEIPVELDKGPHTLAVETCTDAQLRGGFYLVRRVSKGDEPISGR
ncbi:MAG: hypothetical protein HYU52_15130 [Acidobacteria bacterium]|nr:hypothetical protein [Acidobacteriota bacterium]